MYCLKCCIWCLEKFMKYITKNAYIIIAMYGKSFCPAMCKVSKKLTLNVYITFKETSNQMVTIIYI